MRGILRCSMRPPPVRQQLAVRRRRSAPHCDGQATLAQFLGGTGDDLPDGTFGTTQDITVREIQAVAR